MSTKMLARRPRDGCRRCSSSSAPTSSGSSTCRRSSGATRRGASCISEPDAGSDLTNVQTLATAVDGGGRSRARRCGPRTRSAPTSRSSWPGPIGAGPGRAGVELLRPRHASRTASTVRPLRQMSGGFHFNEVFLDDAFVPEDGAHRRARGGFAVLRTDARQRAGRDRRRHERPLGHPAAGAGRRARSRATSRWCGRRWCGPTPASGCSTSSRPVPRRSRPAGRSPSSCTPSTPGCPRTLRSGSSVRRRSVVDHPVGRTVARALPLRTRPAHRRRHRRDPAHHHRRARSRPPRADPEGNT